ILKDAFPDQLDLTSVESLAEALVGLANDTVDVILLDLSLPDASGLETIIKMHKAALNLPIVVLTGYEDEQLALQALREGAQDYLHKHNLDSQLLKRVLRYAVERTRTSQAQRETEERFRALVQHSTDIITILAADGTVLYESPSLEVVMGYKPEAVQGLNMAAFIHPDDLPSLLEGMQNILEQPRMTFTHEGRVRHADGGWRTLEMTMSNLLDQPEIRGYVVNSRDVTERRQTEEAIHFQAQLLSTVGQAVIATNIDNKIIYWNRFAETLYGWSAEEALGRSIVDLTPADTSREQAQAIMARLHMGESWQGELIVQCRDGTRFPVLVTDTPIMDENGALIGIIGVSLDITERKRTEGAIQQSEALLRAVLAALPIGVVITDAKGQITHHNPASQQIWAGAKYLGIDQYEEYKAWWLDSGKRVEADQWAVARAIATGETSLNEELEIERFDRVHRYMLNSAVPILDSDGDVMAVVAVNEDITERKRAELALRHYNQRLGILHS
ncbi:MAG: PAS domain S-box protein, partial [Chloroflexota bacterium]